LSGMGQFVPQPLNYPGTGYWPFYYSIVDPDHVWIGTFHESGLPYSFSAKTTDGGNSWIFDSIPVPGVPVCVSICGWDTNICFHVYTDINGSTGPSIWKTTDGGTTWSNMITAQFTGSFINFYHAFSADTGLAMGDPRDGYFEIQLTYDGGATWTRVPSSNIPAVLPDEMGMNNSYSAVGNSIWFTTSKARCFRSTDRGQTWDVAEVVPGATLDLGVCFSTEQKGAVWNRGTNTNPLVVTNDGGITWDTVSFPADYTIQDMSRVPGLEGGFVVTAYKTGMRVYFTSDLFNTLLILQPSIMSNGAVEFYDAATGWLGGGESGTNEIYKFTWVLNAGGERFKQEKLSILPNPSSGQVLLTLPEGLDSKDIEIRITDMTGKVVTRYPLSEKDYCHLDISFLANGVYLVALYSGNTVLARERCVVNH
jgi:photosystem II stability/assembly factor-like uncharacterized protein